MDNLIKRLSTGERWDGDNAEVLKALGWVGGRDAILWTARSDNASAHPPFGAICAHPLPLDDMNAALRLVPEGWMTDNVEQYDLEWDWTLTKDAEFAAGQGPTAAIALTLAILEVRRG